MRPGDALGHATTSDPSAGTRSSLSQMPRPTAALPGMVIKVPVRSSRRTRPQAGSGQWVLFRKNETGRGTGEGQHGAVPGRLAPTGGESRPGSNTDDLIVLTPTPWCASLRTRISTRTGAGVPGGNARSSRLGEDRPKTKDASIVQVNDRMDTRFKVYEGLTTVEAEARRSTSRRDRASRSGSARSRAPGAAGQPSDFPGRSADFEESWRPQEGE